MQPEEVSCPDPAEDEGDPTSDAALVAAVRAGDEQAAKRLFDRYAELLRERAQRHLPRNLRRKIGASDVIQEAYLAAFVSLGKFEDRDETAFKRWLSQILKNRLQDEIRWFGARKRDARRERILRTQPAGRDPSPSRVMMAAEERAALWKAIDDLPESQQQVIRLVHQEGLRLVDAAERLERSPDAVRKLYARAIARLSRGLGDGEAEQDGHAAS